MQSRDETDRKNDPLFCKAWSYSPCVRSLVSTEVFNSLFIFLSDMWKERKMKNYSRIQEEARHDMCGNIRKNGPERK